MHIIKIVIVLVCALATLRYAASWVPTGETWSTPTAPFAINPNFPPLSGGSPDDQIEAVVSAASAWHHQARSTFEFEFEGPTSTTVSDPFDGENVLFHSTASGGSSLLAVTIRGMSGATMEGFDIIYFGENDLGPIEWNSVGDPSVGEDDIAAVAVHEFGHALGLDHTPVTTATMFGFSIGIGSRTLHSDDIVGVRALYGFDPSLPGGPQINEVSPSTGSSDGGFPVVLSGEGFTWGGDTELRIDGIIIDPSYYVVESMGRIRILAAPPHLPGAVSIHVTNELGSVTIDDAFTYDGPAPSGTGLVSGSSAVAVPGQDGVTVDVRSEADFDLAGYSIGVAFDPSRLSIDYVTLIGTDGEDAEFVAPIYDNVSGWWTLSVAIDISPPYTLFIPGGSEPRSIARAFYTVDPTAPTGFTPLEFENGLGSPTVDIVLAQFSSATTVIPTTLDGGILVVDSPAFVRGDGNRDGIVDLSDAVFHLDWQFSGGPAFCLDAQDANDDGSMDISDAIYLLSYLYSGGGEPHPPFPIEGIDSTVDSIDCSS